MPTNLRTLFRPLLDEIGLPEHEYWEIERVGRVAGIFPVGKTGPGGGTPATTRAVTMAVIALMAGLTKRDGARLAPHYAAAPYRNFDAEDTNAISMKWSGRDSHLTNVMCAVTKKATFGDALEAALSSWMEIAISDVQINHDLQLATINFDGGKSQFGRGVAGDEPLRYTITTIQAPFWAHLAARMAELGIKD